MRYDLQPELTFGSLVLAGSEDSASAYRLYALADDTDWGNPEPVETVIDSMLGDGQLVSIDRDNNRTATIGIRIEASDGRAMAVAEADLVAETRKPNVLAWQPPDAFAPLTVFDVITSYLEHDFDDIDELSSHRRYILHLTLYPHARPDELVVEEALGEGIAPSGAPPVVELVSDCSTLSGWTAATGGGIDPIDLDPDVSPTRIRLLGDAGCDLWMRYDTGAVQVWSDTPYVQVDWAATGNTHGGMPFKVFSATSLNGTYTALAVAASSPSPFGSSYTRTTFKLGDLADSTRYLKFYMKNALSSGGRWGLWLNHVQITDGNAASDGTTRQLSRAVEVRGSARALASIDLRHEGALGDVLVWSGPAACEPPLRSRRVSGNPESADTACVSGKRETIGASPFTADMPISALPSGAYAVMARLRTTSSAGTYTVDVTAQTRLSVTADSDTPVGATMTLDDVAVSLGTGTDWRIKSLGVMHLPVTEIANGTSGFVRLTLQGANVELDEAWVFNITTGDLTWLTGADKIVQLVPPMLDSPRAHIYTGPTDATLYEATNIVNAWGQHRFDPGEWAAHTVTTAVEDAAMTVSYYPRYHTHVAEGL